MQRYMSGMGNSGSISARRDEPLTDDQIHRHVPSIFAEAPHDSRSDKFRYVPTNKVLDALRKRGFQPFFAQQGGSRIEGKAAFTKHMIRLRHPDHKNEQDEAYEIIFMNAHDGTSSFRLMSGVFRFLCLNGLFVGDQFADVRVGHRGPPEVVKGQVIEGAYQVLSQGVEVMGAMDQMKQLRLSGDEQRVYAEAALQLRYDDPDKAPIQPRQLLDTRRLDDSGNDLWKVFNVVQENLARGGLPGRLRRSNGTTQRAKSRPVKAIDGTEKLNRALWTLTQGMQDLKQAA